jgi:hypothetical protein
MYVSKKFQNSKKQYPPHFLFFFSSFSHNRVNMKITQSQFETYLKQACENNEFKHDLGYKINTAGNLAAYHPGTDFASAYSDNIKTKDNRSIITNASRALVKVRGSMFPESDNDSTGLIAPLKGMKLTHHAHNSCDLSAMSWETTRTESHMSVDPPSVARATVARAPLLKTIGA